MITDNLGCLPCASSLSPQVLWDYAPSGSNLCTSPATPFASGPLTKALASVNVTGGALGRAFRKVVYVQYADANFTTRVVRPPEQAYLGMMGPIMRAEVRRNHRRFAVPLFCVGHCVARAGKAAAKLTCRVLCDRLGTSCASRTATRRRSRRRCTCTVRHSRRRLSPRSPQAAENRFRCTFCPPCLNAAPLGTSARRAPVQEKLGGRELRGRVQRFPAGRCAAQHGAPLQAAGRL